MTLDLHFWKSKLLITETSLYVMAGPRSEYNISRATSYEQCVCILCMWKDEQVNRWFCKWKDEQAKRWFYYVVCFLSLQPIDKIPKMISHCHKETAALGSLTVLRWLRWLCSPPCCSLRRKLWDCWYGCFHDLAIRQARIHCELRCRKELSNPFIREPTTVRHSVPI